MSSNLNDTLVEKTVTYTLEMNGKFYLIENVPARINPETEEQFFSPSTVERLQQIIYDQQEPIRIVETPVYNFAA
ncbi:hypothetical protein CLI64_15740 [Nostoc sp. CENA543]|uniref:hypothetical protein n=1 Tax=Nostoc sp. CENA543 TaxID=1869241 RepID=UPI000CA29489|nr:hypothetical protein [Nostoc sp. CENA543]AUT01719.1 hypothetical protein CLI64_15740 [Nostoc sp. CENA543]